MPASFGSWYTCFFLHPLQRQSLEQETPLPMQGQRVRPLLSCTHDSWPSLLFFPQEHTSFLVTSGVDLPEARKD